MKTAQRVGSFERENFVLIFHLDGEVCVILDQNVAMLEWVLREYLDNYDYRRVFLMKYRTF